MSALREKKVRLITAEMIIEESSIALEEWKQDF